MDMLSNYGKAVAAIGDVDVDELDLAERLALAQVWASLAIADEIRAAK